MLAKKLYVYLSIGLLLFPLKVAFGLESKQDYSNARSKIQSNKDLHNRNNAVPDPPTGSEGRPGGGTGSGGTRGGCPEDENLTPDLTLLIPDDRVGLTVAEYPTFFAFVPETKTRVGEFVLYDRTEKKLIYRTTLDLNGIPGIVSVELPKDRDSLKIGNDYEWRFLLHCKSNDDRSSDVMKTGRIQRVVANRAIASIQSNTNPLEKARVYQENNIWYDAVQALAELRPTTTSNANAANMWQQLLRNQQRLNAIVSYPLIDCCKPVN